MRSMTSPTSLLRVAVFCVPALVASAGAQAQRFLELGSRVDDLVTAGQGAEAFAAEIDIGLLRAAPERLALPTPDGRVLVAELSVFEDRGNGDLMWAGGFAEAGFESVVFTVRDGYLSGRFDEPDRAKFRITSGPDGRGRMIDVSRPPPTRVGRAYCPGGVMPKVSGPVGIVEAGSSDPPERSAGRSNEGFLDVLVAYTPSASAHWKSASQTPESASQAAIDYLNMAFRNGQLDASARLAGVVPAPLSVTEARTGDAPGCKGWLDRLVQSARLKRLRADHAADIVHLFLTDEDGATDCAGFASIPAKGETPRDFSPHAAAFTNIGFLPEEVFAHEVGHNLGLDHEPESFDPSLPGNAGQPPWEVIRHDRSILPYAFAHVMAHAPDRMTIMGTSWTTVPWFSTVREEPMGWKLGVRDERENERALREVGLGMGVRYSNYLPGRPEPPSPPPPPGWRPYSPTNLKAIPLGTGRVRLIWTDRAVHEDGFLVEGRPAGRRSWREAKRLPKNTVAVDLDGLAAGERYDFRVLAYNANGRSDPLEVVTVSLAEGEYTDCVPSAPQIAFEHGYTVSMCVEYLADGVGPLVVTDARDYGLESRESGILYFFDRDNAEVLVKVLDACAVNGHRWVFVAPVTSLAFNLHIDETASGKRWTHRNTKGGRTASTKSDVTAFPCPPNSAVASHAGAGGGTELVESGIGAARQRRAENRSGAPRRRAAAAALGTGQATDCEPDLGLILAGGYSVSLCYETRDGKVDDARNWKLASSQSGLLYFFNRDNAEVLIKVLDGCGVNGHRWVFVAPVTDLAFNLVVESPTGEVWTHRGFQGLTASAKSDIRAFPCN